MSNHLKNAARGTVQTPQSEPMREDQVANSAGGFAWAVDSFTRLRRFLILGSEGGSYYASERDLTKENVQALDECLKTDGPQTVNEIVAVSVDGRAPKNDGAIFALAYAVAHGNDNTKRIALANLHRVCRIGTHLFMFCGFLDTMSGWGRAKRSAVTAWYTEKDAGKLAYDAVKYRQRDGWSHRDVLRLAHPVTDSEDHQVLFSWITHGWPDWEENMAGRETGPHGASGIVEGFERAQRAKDAKETAALVREYGLPREALLTEHLTAPEVWDALLDAGMGITALIRNLATMTRIGLVTPTSDALVKVLAALSDGDKIVKGRVHPLNILFALKTYESGQGFRGSNTWKPVPKVVDALSDAFYLAFGAVEPTGKRILMGLDVSGSMGAHIGGTNLSAREGSAAMALVTAAVEDRYEVVAFSDARQSGFAFRSPHRGRFASHHGIQDALTVVPLSARQRLDDVLKLTDAIPMGGTDCALPMLYAIENEREVDTFLIYTDNETWHGDIHPAQALAKYRKVSGIEDARLVVVGMTSGGFSIADPKDPGMLDVVGFDTATPSIISEFSKGNI